ncbi:uncharacterized protein [Polyergus mexicanus]|uniref:uncharacterized protein n=1 Tax=Polyergus mexicanus TaxID=615972 RepID=UPI0038B638E7
MSKEMEATINLQFDLYGRIARSYENLKKVGSAQYTIGLVEARLQALESNWGKFDTQHDKLLSTHREVLSGHEYLKKDMQSLTEEAYIAQKSMFLDILRSLKDKVGATTPAVSANPVQTSRTTLPRIQLPQFSGRYEEWPSFRDLFNSLIVKDASTAQVEKLHYLKTCLKGEAELLIRSLPTTAENFDRAWKILTGYYENKRLLVRSYISRFAALPKLKSESATKLRKLYHGVMSTVGALESIGRPITRGEDLFVHLVVDLLDSRSRREWETSIGDATEPPSYIALQLFIDRRLHTLESLQSSQPETSPAKSSLSSGRPTRCSICSQNHYIMFCDGYKAKTAAEKRQHVEANNLCFNCLGKHKLSECTSQKTCLSCRARHHTTLHDTFKESEVATSLHFAQRSREATVLLATARVRVKDQDGVVHTARALLDQGSDSSMITSSLARRLRLVRQAASIRIIGVGGKPSGRANSRVEFQILPQGRGSPITVTAMVFLQITTVSGGFKGDRRAWTHFRGLRLTEPDLKEPDPLDILLGADVYAEILQPGLRKGAPDELIAQRTSLGWILSGPTGTTGETMQRNAQSYHCQTDEDLSSLVSRFWQQEELPVSGSQLTPEDQECEEFFIETHARTAEGRYVVRLPVVAPLPDLSSTRFSA